MKLRTHIPYGYKSVSGGVWQNCQVDSYNLLQDRINAFLEAKMPIPEYLDNGSFHLFCTYDRANAVR